MNQDNFNGKSAENQGIADFDAEYLRLIKADIVQAQANLDNLPERDRRGLTLETLRHFGCGYLTDWVLTKSRAELACGLYVDENGKEKHLPPPSARIIIPTKSMEHINGVAINRLSMDKKFWKQHAGKMELFCDSAALDADLIVIVEGEMDAMSIYQATAGKVAVVAILGCGNWKKTLLPKLENLREKHLIILFDADSAGKKSAERLRTELAGRGHVVVAKYLYDAMHKADQNDFGWKVDANEILKYKGDDDLKFLIEKIIAEAAPDFARLENEKEQWRQRVRANNAHPSPELPIPTPKTKKAPSSGAIEENFGDNADCKEIKLILNEYVHASDLTRNDWRDVGVILKRYGFALDDFKKWSNDGDSRYDEDACDAIWRDFDTATGATNNPLTIATLINLAKQFGYQPKRKRADRADFHNDSRADARSVEDIIADIRDYQCEWKVNKKGERLYIMPTYNNARIIFDNDPNLKNLIGYDEFQDAIVLRKKARWQKGLRVDSEWSDKDDAQLRLYLRKNYADFQAKQLVEDMVIEISQANAFNPVKDYFTTLPQWDGVERVGKFFINYLRVDDTPYAREVTWNWFIGAIARIFHVGCRYQTALVLHGAQGVGKSYSIERLGGKWYLELTDNVDDSHAADAIKKGWLVEIKEMSAMRRAEINAVKAFIERGQETRRAAYDKRATTVYRHCVFAITVNDSEFLRDQTGNRRYMILHCGSKARDYIEEVDGESLSDDNVIDQIWAEAYARYTAMFANGFNEQKLLLSRDTARQADEFATKYLQDDGMAGEVKAFLDKKILPQYIWQLLTREERRKFFADGRLVLPDGLADLNKRRRARGGKEDVVQHDVNLISGFLDGVAGKNFVRRNEIKRGDDTITEYIAYGSEYRQHICANEILNECFGNDKRKSMYRISEILNQLEGWHLEKRLQGADSVYYDQKKPYYRDADNVPADALIIFDENDMPF